MKKIILLLLLSQFLSAQYTITSQYLQTPEMMFGFVDSCARFWMKAYEPVSGGFYVNINRQGNLSGSTIKNTMNQSRNAYGFIRAFQLTGDTAYLRYARYGLEFMYKNSWDKTYGGWYNDINSAGTPSNVNANKTAFYQHYALLGIAASYEATRDTTDRNWLKKGYDYIGQKMWDSSASYFGYYDFVSANGTNPTNKSFNATVDAVTTHLLHLYLLTGEQRYKTRLLQVADNMINRLAASNATQAIGFAEKYNSTWQINASETMTIMGHVLKTAWCLARIYQLEKDPLYLSTAEMLVQDVLDKGYDHVNGGPYKDYNRVTGQMLMWGITDTAKAWWQMEQAVTAGLMLYETTGKEKYLKMADETLDFFMKYFVDHVYGEVFENANKYGGMIAQWGTTKGGTGKAGYHSIELGYYVYLYGKLLVKKELATLYYSFDHSNDDRRLRMRPIGMPEGYYKISSVTRNGSAYMNFDSTDLSLTIPTSMNGIFAVTYAPTQSVLNIAGNNSTPHEYILYQNYPNPFNPGTTIRFQIPMSGPVTLTVYDMLGKEIERLVKENKEAGVYTVKFNARNLSSGIYFYRLESGSYVQTKKFVLMK